MFSNAELKQIKLMVDKQTKQVNRQSKKARKRARLRENQKLRKLRKKIAAVKGDKKVHSFIDQKRVKGYKDSNKGGRLRYNLGLDRQQSFSEYGQFRVID